jgi:hypothetical protein
MKNKEKEKRKEEGKYLYLISLKVHSWKRTRSFACMTESKKMGHNIRIPTSCGGAQPDG